MHCGDRFCEQEKDVEKGFPQTRIDDHLRQQSMYEWASMWEVRKWKTKREGEWDGILRTVNQIDDVHIPKLH